MMKNKKVSKFRNLIWRIRRLFLSPTDRRTLDFFVDDDNGYQLDRLESKIGKHNVQKAVEKNLITVDRDESIELISLDTVQLTQEKGVPLMMAKTTLAINWAKWAAIAAILAVFTPIALYIYDKHEINSQKTLTYDYAFNSSEDKGNYRKAECWVNGIGGRSDAYKCAEGNRIYAPCFRDMGDSTDKVKCPVDPYDNSKSKYFNAKFSDDTKPLMDDYGKTPDPWFIELASGERCGFLYGATTTVANRRMDFGCVNNNLSLYLPTSEKEGTYTIGCLKQDKLEQCKIKEMWR